MSQRLRLAALLSGVSALICEIAWVRPLRLLMGDTVIALSAALMLFFLGLALGNAWAARRSAFAAQPFRLVCLLEIGIAAAIIVATPLLFLIDTVHFAALQALGPQWNVPLGLLLAGALILPPTVGMGATLPLLIQGAAAPHSDPTRQRAAAARLAHWNTLGGVLGALAAGLWLIPRLGSLTPCGIAALLNIAAAGLLWSIRGHESATRPVIQEAHIPLGAGTVLLLAGTTGFALLGFEIVWARGLSGALTNSGASGALMLAATLLGLTLGYGIAARLDLADPVRPLATLAILAALAAALSAFPLGHAIPLLTTLHRGFEIEGTTGALVSEMVLALAVVLLPAVFLGILFPLLFEAWLGPQSHPGRRWGLLVAANTLGAVAGTLLTALLLIPTLGVQGSLVVLCLLLAGVGGLIWPRCSPPRRLGWALLIITVAIVTSIGLWHHPGPPLPAGYELIARREGRGATVSVVESSQGQRSMLLNDRYVVGGTGGLALEYRQALIPALLHPNPERVFHLGTGTGHTAAALAAVPNVETLVTCDNATGVLRMAREHFSETNRALFEEPNVEILHADGRHWLAAHTETFDLIVIDNLLPWLDGAGLMMTSEMFALEKERLNEEGILCVWLPLHQIDLEMLRAIHGTLAEQFPQVHLWLARPNLETSIGLIATRSPLSLGHLADDPRFASAGLRGILAGALITGPEDVFAGLSGLNAVAPTEVTLTDFRPETERMALDLFLNDLVHHPDLISSPSQRVLWALLTEARSGAQAELAAGLGDPPVEGEGGEATIWRRWLSQSKTIEGLGAMHRGEEEAPLLWAEALRIDPENPAPAQLIEQALSLWSASGNWSSIMALREVSPAPETLGVNGQVALALALFESGQHFQARLRLEEIWESHPDSAEAGFGLLRVLGALPGQPGAEELAQNLVEKFPEDRRSETVEWALRRRSGREPHSER